LQALESEDRERLRENREQSGLIAAMLYNVNRGKNSKPMQPLDFWRPAEPDGPTADDLARLAYANQRLAEMRGETVAAEGAA
jgi:hypothetical protein